MPILLVSGISFVAGRQLKLETRSFGQLIFYVFSPALAFYLLYTSEIQASELGVLFIGTSTFQISMALLTFIVLKVQRVPRAEASAVIISSFCLNAGNFGLSVISFAYGQDVLARAAVIFISNLVINNTLGVFVASSGKRSPIEALKMIIRVPSVYAIPLAFLLRALSIDTLPLVIMRPIELLSSAAIPCMLVLLGLQLSQSARMVNFRLMSTGLVLKMLIAPFIGLLLAVVLNMDPIARAAFITQVSMPTGVITLLLASEYDLDRDLTLSMILATTFLSPITLSIIIWLLR